jgi:hypothetical protein
MVVKSNEHLRGILTSRTQISPFFVPVFWLAFTFNWNLRIFQASTSFWPSDTPVIFPKTVWPEENVPSFMLVFIEDTQQRNVSVSAGGHLLVPSESTDFFLFPVGTCKPNDEVLSTGVSWGFGVRKWSHSLLGYWRRYDRIWDDSRKEKPYSVSIFRATGIPRCNVLSLIERTRGKLALKFLEDLPNTKVERNFFMAIKSLLSRIVSVLDKL